MMSCIKGLETAQRFQYANDVHDSFKILRSVGSAQSLAVSTSWTSRS